LEHPIDPPSASPNSREKSDSSDKRTRILDAAHEVCARDGIEGARMEDVAALAGVSKGTLYHFFENKQDLFLASMIASYEETLGLFEPEVDLQSLDPRLRLDAVLRGMASILNVVSSRMTVHYQAWGIVAGDEGARGRLYGFLTQFFRDRGQDFEDLIKEGQARGVFRADADVAAITDALLALLSGFLYRATFDPTCGSEERLAACYESLLRGALYIDAPSAAEEDSDA
jgi:AcrR family transcriptional regulator